MVKGIAIINQLIGETVEGDLYAFQTLPTQRVTYMELRSSTIGRSRNVLGAIIIGESVLSTAWVIHADLRRSALGGVTRGSCRTVLQL